MTTTEDERKQRIVEAMRKGIENARRAHKRREVMRENNARKRAGN